MKKNGKKIILISIIVVMFVAIGVAAYIYFGTETFKTPKEMFQKYSGKTVAMLQVDNQSKSLVSDYATQLKENSYEKKDNVSISASGKNVSNELNKVNLSLDTKYNKEQETKTIDASLNYNQDVILNANYAEDKDKIALCLPQVINKYLSLNKGEYSDLLAKFGMNLKVDKDKVNQIDYNQLFSLSDEEETTLINTYAGVIFNSIDASSYTKQRKVNTMVNDQYMETKTYTLSLTKSETQNCMKNILTYAKDDSYLLDLINSKAQLLGNTDSVKEDVQKYIQSEIDTLDEAINNCQDPSVEYLKVVIYTNGSSICKIDVTIEDKLYTLTVIKNTSDDLLVNVVFNADTIDENTIPATYTAEFERVVKENSIGMSYNLETKLSDGTTSNLGIKYVLTKNSDTETQNIIKITNNNNNTKYEITLDGKVAFGSNVEVATVAQDNCFDLNQYNQEQLTQLLTAITNRVKTILDDKKEEILFANSNNNENSIKCERVNNLSVSKDDKAVIQEAIKKRGYFTYDSGDKHYLIISSGVKSTGGYTLNLGEIKAKGGNLEVNVDEKYVDEYANQNEENQTITYPFMVLELSKSPDFLLVRNDELRFQFAETDLAEIKKQLSENQEDTSSLDTADGVAQATAVQ